MLVPDCDSRRHLFTRWFSSECFAFVPTDFQNVSLPTNRISLNGEDDNGDDELVTVHYGFSFHGESRGGKIVVPHRLTRPGVLVDVVSLASVRALSKPVAFILSVRKGTRIPPRRASLESGAALRARRRRRKPCM